MDVYGIVTDKILAQLDKGTIPWRCPWRKGDVGIPKNLVSKKPYSGINPFMLTVESIFKGYTSPYWLTYKQAQDLGGHVKRGERSSIVVFWKMFSVINKATGETEDIPMLRYYSVFNTDQCDGIQDKLAADASLTAIAPYKHNPIEAAEKIVAEMPNRPAIESKVTSRAFYRPSTDSIHIPSLAQFENPAEYYSTLFHELGHSTGHETRLKRQGITDTAFFGSHEYSKEELVAEFTASFLCATAEIERGTLGNSAAYIRGWSDKLKDQNNRKWVVWAASQAQKAADFVLGRVRTEEPTTHEQAA